MKYFVRCKDVCQALLLTAAALAVADTAKAAPLGILAVDSCAGQVTVTATAIDFTAGAGFPTQCVQAGSTANVTSTFGNITPGMMGTISDLVGPLPPGGTVFLSFDPIGGAAGLLNFVLTAVGPGSSNTNCAIASDTTSCSILLAPGVVSPFILLGNATNGTTARLNVSGTVTDASGTSTFAGSFSADFSGQSPLQLQQQFESQGSITSTYSGRVSLSAIPEPGSMALMGFGLVGLGIFARRRTRRAV